MTHGSKKKSSLETIREHLACIGDKEFRSTDMPIVSNVHRTLKDLEDNEEIVMVRWDKGKVYRVIELKDGKPAEPEFEIAAPHPYKPFLRGYEVIGRFVNGIAG